VNRLGTGARATLLAGLVLAAAAEEARGADVPSAEEAWASGRREEAARLVREYVSENPESVRSARVAALLARTAEDPTEAIGRWDEVLALEPEGPLAAEARWNRGIQAYSAGLYVAAGSEFDLLAESFADEFDRGRALLWRGYAELGADRAEAALASFEAAEGEATDRADVRSAELGQAHAAFRLGRIDEALRRYESFERSHRDDGRASAAARRTVECYRLLGREDDAARTAARIERDYPDSREATLARAEVRGAARERAATAEDGAGADETEGRTPAAPAGPFVVQAAAMSDPRNAAVLRRQIRALRVGEVRVEPGEGPDGPVHRVVVGPYDTEDEARAAAEAIAGLGDLNPRVRPAAPPR
jgi:tetratricopeptide (TPR) repeat protein